jgi:hypothetical protein
MRRANEIMLVAETLKGHTISKEQLIKLQEEFNLDWEKCEIHLDLLDDHFVDQLNRNENRCHPISFPELESILEQFTKKHREKVSKLDHNSYGVIQEPHTFTNVVFFVDENSKFEQKKDVRLITIMRKKDFKTHNQVYEINLE